MRYFSSPIYATTFLGLGIFKASIEIVKYLNDDLTTECLDDPLTKFIENVISEKGEAIFKSSLIMLTSCLTFDLTVSYMGPLLNNVIEQHIIPVYNGAIAAADYYVNYIGIDNFYDITVAG